jgi:hypothetical protein
VGGEGRDEGEGCGVVGRGVREAQGTFTF